jgi:hypothetical protein
MYTPYGHVSKPLTTLASNYTWEGGIADLICPRVPTGGQETGKYPIFGSEEIFARSDILGDKSKAQEINWYVGWGYFQTIPRGLRGFVPGRLLAGADAVIKPKATTTRKVKAALDILREIRLVSLIDATVGITGMDSGDQTNSWATPATGKPLDDIASWKRAFKAATGRKPNTIVIPDQIIPHLVATDQWQKQVVSVQGGRIENYDDLPGTICGMKPLIPSQQYAPELLTSATTPATMPTVTDVWGDNVYLMWVNPRPSIFDASACYDLSFIPETIRTYPDPELGIRGGLWIQCEFQSVQKMINSYLLYRGQNVI